jgi:MFS transporter, ACS family, tartrate transporter
MHFETLEFPKPSHAFGSGQTHTEVIVGIETATPAMSIEARTIQKMRIRILPFVLLLFVVSLLVYFGMMIGYYALQSWTPQLVKSLSSLYSSSVIGLLVMIPNLVGLAAMILVSRSSDRKLERRYHVAIPAIAVAGALEMLGATRSPFYSVTLLSFVAAGVYGFWTLPSEFLTGYSAAGIALVNSVGNLGGFAGPYMIGAIAMRTGNLYAGLAIAGVSLFISATLMLLLPKKARAPTKS